MKQESVQIFAGQFRRLKKAYIEAYRDYEGRPSGVTCYPMGEHDDDPGLIAAKNWSRKNVERIGKELKEVMRKLSGVSDKYPQYPNIEHCHSEDTKFVGIMGNKDVYFSSSKKYGDYVYVIEGKKESRASVEDIKKSFVLCEALKFVEKKIKRNFE